MSTSCDASSSCPIPRRASLPQSFASLPGSYSQTPGGTVFSTTPGGTRIIYDRNFLLECRNSPIARTPPCCLPHIPGVTMLSAHPLDKLLEQDEVRKSIHTDDNQFVLDI
ncbi:hypothetical protein Q7C36_018014 [Tachysurus vachellii]|uniref:Eukaryotic translation initiation factor 4E binding protein 3 n=1 Tax=Tachysurus vachellii TaxID=175792 RepID=A0AA88M1I8_TACVA|nr:eukaryotic translation initiation factor 4E-binding protein 3 [Tachysurus vachellii]KAK2827088.1 hypothetical protein Q7C36_018014 [Tachysurus vachellii]